MTMKGWYNNFKLEKMGCFYGIKNTKDFYKVKHNTNPEEEPLRKLRHKKEANQLAKMVNKNQHLYTFKA